MGFNSGQPMSSGTYNNTVMIFQAPGYVAILNGMVHNAGSFRSATGRSRPFRSAEASPAPTSTSTASGMRIIFPPLPPLH